MYGFTVNCNGDAVANLRKIEAALAAAGVTAKVEVREIESQFTGLGEKVKGVFSELKGLVAGGLIGGGIFGGFEFIKSGKEAFDKLEESVTRVKTVLQSTGFKAGFSADDIDDQAKEMSKHIVAGRAQIMDAQGMALSFTNVRGNIFKESMNDVADFATFYKEDLTSAALQVDKAINDPAKGFRRLQRQGVAFTDEQEKQIKNYEKQGELAKAQAVILKELHTEFGGQAAAFAMTDEGKMAMDAKQWGSIKLEIGEVISKLQLSLLPLFADIRSYVKEAFESAPVQFFLAHIKDLLDIGLKIIPMWVIYKGILASTALVTSLFSAENGILTLSMGSLTVMTDGATVAAEGFAAAWSATGVGAIAVALGLLVEHLISMNKELDETLDKKYKLSDTKDFYKQYAQKNESIKERLTLLNDPNFGTREKQELAADVQTALHTARLKTPELEQRASMLANASKTPLTTGGKITALINMGGMGDYSFLSKSLLQKEKTYDALDENMKNLKQFGMTIPDLKDAAKLLAKKGIKPPKGYSPGGGVTGDATNTSELAGPKGGLGEAKVININFHDALQKVTVADGRGVVSAGQDAIDFIIRAMQNFAYSQSTTQ